MFILFITVIHFFPTTREILAQLKGIIVKKQNWFDELCFESRMCPRKKDNCILLCKSLLNTLSVSK